jgi:hypothetical protein
MASIKKAEEEVESAHRAYQQKLANLIALAKAVLAAKPADGGGVGSDPNDPHKGHQ